MTYRCLASQVVPGFFDSSAQGGVIRQPVTGDPDGARGNVDLDAGDAGELADFCADGAGTVVAGHACHFERAGFHDCE
jgi:hypothetical protein